MAITQIVYQGFGFDKPIFSLFTPYITCNYNSF